MDKIQMTCLHVHLYFRTCDERSDRENAEHFGGSARKQKAFSEATEKMRSILEALPLTYEGENENKSKEYEI